jgi:hypothetical protein
MKETQAQSLESAREKNNTAVLIITLSKVLYTEADNIDKGV